jgi:hypothetical protein
MLRREILFRPAKLKFHGRPADQSNVSSFAETQGLYSSAGLAALVRDFDRNPVTNRKHITEFLQYEPEIFYRTAVGILKIDVDSRASQYLVALLVHGNLLFRALCDPALDLERATEVARRASRGDPKVDIKLARELADAGATGAGLPTGTAERLLQIIDGISDSKRILPSLMRMLRNDNPHVRSKAVLMIGRSGRSLKWIQKRFQETDTRVRANAIEATWGIDTEPARELLEWATRDSNNRVVGNALVGLYRLGEISSLAELVQMAGNDSAASRCTAAWAMGETGDPRFSEVLGRMIADTNGNVRRSAFVAVRRIRTAAAQVSQTVRWPVAATADAKNSHTGERRVSVAVVTADGRGIPRILPAQFLLSEDGQSILSYRVEERMPPDLMTVIFLFPRTVDNFGQPWDQGGLRCIRWKRPADLWSTAPYSTAESCAQEAEGLDSPPLTASAPQAAGFWTAVHRAVLPGNAAVQGKRHVIVLAPDEVDGDADDALISAVQESRASIRVVSPSENPLLREFCRRIDGHFRYVEDPSAIEEAVSLAYLSLLARYEIHYHPVSKGAATLKLRVHTPAGWGETKVDC